MEREKSTIITIEKTVYDLYEKYDHFNKLCFNSSLPAIPLSFCKMKNAGGRTSYNVSVIRNGRKIVSAKLVDNTLCVKLTNIYNRTISDLDGILLHEMVHVKMVVDGKFYESHGNKFCAELERVQSLVNFKVPMRDVVSDLETNSSVAKRDSVCVIVLKTQDGRIMYSLFNTNSVLKTMENLKTFVKNTYKIDRFGIFKTNDKEWIAQSYKLTCSTKLSRNTNFYKLQTEKLSELIHSGITLHQEVVRYND